MTLTMDDLGVFFKTLAEQQSEISALNNKIQEMAKEMDIMRVQAQQSAQSHNGELDQTVSKVLSES